MEFGYKLTTSDKEARLFRMGFMPMLAIDEANVNIDDLMQYIPGGVIRCYINPADCITILQIADDSSLGCVAGWISEEE